MMPRQPRSLREWLMILAILIACTLMVLGGRGQSKPVKGTREYLTMVYERQIGVREKTGNNDGVMVEYYLRTVGLGKGFPWCAAFEKACFLLNGMVIPQINGLASSTFNPKNVVYEKRKFLKEPQPGDVFVLFYTSLNRIGHTLFYHKRVNSSIFESVEGNTNSAGSREGDGVYKKKRSFHQVYKGSSWFKS